MADRKIIHIDMDCFYAAVEMKYQPRFKSVPLAIGGSADGRGVLTTANYLARKFGVRSAMSSRYALRLCPELVIVAPDFSKYKAESKKVHCILSRYTNQIEPLSLDEAYLDVSESNFENGIATRIAERIRREIRDELGLTASAGVAPNKFLAKIASDLNKPDGLAIIRPEQVLRFVYDLPIEKIWGVGKITANKMRALGFRTCGDLQKNSLEEMHDLFGSFGIQLYEFARGIDRRQVKPDRARKSLTVEETFSKNLVSRAEIKARVPELFDDFYERLQRYPEIPIKSVLIKLKFDDFKTRVHEGAYRINSSQGLPELEVLKIEFEKLLDAAMDGETRTVRLLGLGVRFHAKTEPRKNEIQQNLF